MKFQMKKKEDFFVLGFGIILVILVVAIAVITTDSKNNLPKEVPPQPSPTITDESSFVPPPIYNQRAQDRLLAKIENRKALSEQDAAAKIQILKFLPTGQKSGVIYESPNIRIDYTNGADLFQVEILTTKLNSAKEEGNKWFRDQGISQQGICDLPIDFYLSWEVAQVLQGKYVSFNPLAPGCT